MAKLKLGIAKLNSADLIFFCKRVETKLTGNENFPDPTPSLAAITTKREELTALDIRSQTGDRTAIYERNTVAKELKNMLRTLSLYISLMAMGDAEIILSSGFELRKASSPTAPLSRPSDLLARRSDHAGKVKLKWRPVKNAVNSVIELTTDDPNEPTTKWSTAGLTSQSKFMVENLTPGIYYWFRVKAFGRRHQSPYSDPALIMAA